MTKPRVRLRKAERSQVELISAALDDLLPDDHWVRVVWQHVEKLELSVLHARIKAVEGEAGRDATDPRILLCLWLVALSEGIGSARRLAELTERDLVYRWICGGVSVNRDLLADFRANRRKELDELVVQNLAALMKAGVVTLDGAAQDGMKVRACAGASSFRREESLHDCLEKAKQHLARIDSELEEAAGPLTRRNAARKRAAEEKLAAVERALAELPAVIEAKKAQPNKTRAQKSAPRVSTTDSDARVMKMPDGGFRPAYNPQFLTDVDSGVIVGINVSNKGTDSQEVEPVIVDVLTRTQRVPQRYLMDGGYVSHLNIEGLTAAGIEVFTPVRPSRKGLYDPYEPQPGEPVAVSDWRKRMGTMRGKAQYKQRAATAERANAQLRTTALQQLTVRGLEKVTSAILLSVLAFNIDRTIALLS